MSTVVSGAIIVLKLIGSDNYIIGTESVFRQDTTSSKSTVGYLDFDKTRTPKFQNKKLDTLAQDISNKFAIDLSSFRTNLCCNPIASSIEFVPSQDNKESVQKLLVENYHTIGGVDCHYSLGDNAFEQRKANTNSNGFIKGGKKASDGAGFEGTARREFKEETFFNIDNSVNYPLTYCGDASDNKRIYSIYAAEVDISNCNGILAAYQQNERKSEIFNLRSEDLSSGTIRYGNAISGDALRKVRAFISRGSPLSQWTAPVPPLPAVTSLSLPLFPQQAPNIKYQKYQAKYLKYKAKYLALKQTFNL